jgi:hypothetical protein
MLNLLVEPSHEVDGVVHTQPQCERPYSHGLGVQLVPQPSHQAVDPDNDYSQWYPHDEPLKGASSGPLLSGDVDTDEHQKDHSRDDPC